MNHESFGKTKEGIMNNEGQMIPLPPSIVEY